jgi:diaminopimelate decarboxylase
VEWEDLRSLHRHPAGPIERGAYASAIASNYNDRSLAAEVLVDGVQSAVVRRRQPLEEIWSGESIPSWLR